MNRDLIKIKIDYNSNLHPSHKQCTVKSKINLLLCIWFLFSSWFVCISANANVYFKTTFMCLRSIAGVLFDSSPIPACLCSLPRPSSAMSPSKFKSLYMRALTPTPVPAGFRQSGSRPVQTSQPINGITTRAFPCL